MNQGQSTLRQYHGGCLLILFIWHSMITFFNRGEKAVSLTSHRTCSTLFPRVPRLINSLPEGFFHTLLYCMRPATIESPIMMLLMLL